MPMAKCWSICQNGVIKTKWIIPWCVEKRLSLQINQDNFTNILAKLLENNNYKLAFKAATQELHDAQNGPNNGLRGYGDIAICKQYNNKYNLDGVIYWNLKPQTIRNIPECLHWRLVSQRKFLHNSQGAVTKGKSSGCNMIPLIKAMTLGTIWEGKWRNARKDHPEHFVPAQAKNYKDRRAELLTAQNVNDWIDNHKNVYLI